MATHMKLMINLKDFNDVTAHAVDATIKDGKIVDEKPTGEAVKCGPDIRIEDLFDRGPIQLGVLYYTHSSPGCVTYIGNKKYELC